MPWRLMTVDIDLKPDPEPPGLFEAIAILEDELDVLIEPQLIRYPAIDPASFRKSVNDFCDENG